MKMDTERKKCANKKCENMLPADDRHRYCEACRTVRAERRRAAGAKIVDLLCAPGVVAMSIATRGNRNYQQKK